jgi:LAO/AO transport system kinase
LTGLLRSRGLTAGIIGVDPTSPYTGGALLGDRVRMQRHYLDSGVFIRSVASRGESGGLPRIVKGITRLMDAAGIDVVLVETVGVGQVELGIMEVADTVLVSLTPESGDAIQTLKAGIMEIADIYLINKADRDGANQLATAITSMLHLASARSDWTPPVLLATAQSGQGIDELWVKVEEHRGFLTGASLLAQRRRSRRQKEFLETLEEEVAQRLKLLIARDPDLIAALDDVADKTAEPYSSAKGFLESAKRQPGWLAPILANPD